MFEAGEHFVADVSNDEGAAIETGANVTGLSRLLLLRLGCCGIRCCRATGSKASSAHDRFSTF
jgi:hypothetical protein